MIKKDLKCPLCSGLMQKVEDQIKQDKVSFAAYKCTSCGEELVNMEQLKELAHKYRELRKAKEITFARWGNSLAIRIPQEFAEDLAIKEGDHGLLKRSKEGLEIMAA